MMKKRIAFMGSLGLLLLLGVAYFAHASRTSVFIGDSITEQWPFPLVNDGIHGQTSAQILARVPFVFQTNHYRKAFFLAGTNDVLLAVPFESTAANIEAMGTAAEQAHLQPVLATIPPIFIENGRLLPNVESLNERIAKIASKHGWLLIDYFGALQDHPQDLVGGVHMKRRSYLRMEMALLRTTNPF